MKTITVKLDDNFYKKMKIKLVNEEKTIQEYIANLISMNLNEK